MGIRGVALLRRRVGRSRPVPSGPIAELTVHCAWGYTSSEAACTALIKRLEAVERPSRAERLALIWSRNLLRGFDPRPGGEACAATEALAAEHPDYADALDFGGAEGVRRSSLALACQSALYGYLGLEEVCLSGVEKVAWRASADGLPLPGYVATSWPNTRFGPPRLGRGCCSPRPV